MPALSFFLVVRQRARALQPAEAKLLDDLLYELRMRFVQAQQNEKRIITP